MTGRSLIPRPRWALRSTAESRTSGLSVAHRLGFGLTNVRVALAAGEPGRRLLDRDQHGLGLGMIGVLLENRVEKLAGFGGELQVQAPESQLHALVGIALGKLGQSVFVCLADRVERALDSFLGKVHGADRAVRRDTRCGVSETMPLMSWPLVSSRYRSRGLRQLLRPGVDSGGEGRQMRPDRVREPRSQAHDHAEPRSHDNSIEGRHARSNPEVAVGNGIDPTVIGNGNVTFWSKWWRDVSPDPRIRQDDFVARHRAD